MFQPLHQTRSGGHFIGSPSINASDNTFDPSRSVASNAAPPSDTRIIGLIPARLASTRLPNKPLVDIHGWPMLRHVWARAGQAAKLDFVAIATPDAAVFEAAQAFGARVLMTSEVHLSGTDRLAEAARLLDLAPDDIVINIQGDEPLLDPASVQAALRLVQDDETLLMSSLMCPCPRAEWDNPACVKVVCAQNGDALYFSRARLPFPRQEQAGSPVMQHIGLYAYRNHFLQTFARLAPTPLERTESLEQLRVLEHGYRIRMVRVSRTGAYRRGHPRRPCPRPAMLLAGISLPDSGS